MESTPTMPICRRRQLILGVVAIAALCTWWWWPRGDARIVGTWALIQTGNPNRQAVVRFQRNGVMRLDYKTGGHALETEWAVVGEHLWTGPRSRFKRQILAWVSSPYFLVTGQSLVHQPTRMRILNVTSRTFQVADDLGKASYTYERIVE